ncbi:MAG: endonuclease III domain-containing protein [Gemmatimonadota bacterium]
MESNAAARAREIERRLTVRHGPASKPRLDPLEELILTILSQNTTDRNRDRAWHALRAEFPSWETVLRAPRARLEATIRAAGLASRKARAIQRALRRLADEVGAPSLDHLAEMEDEEALGYLTGFSGVGLKTAACVLCFSLGRALLPVDTHVHRVTRRLGLISADASRDAAYRSLNRTVPPEVRFSLHVQLIRHGRTICTAARPACRRCALEELCPKVGLP